MVKSNLKSVEKSKSHDKQTIKEISNTNEQNLDDVKYKPIDHFYTLQSQNKLHENEMLLIFNKKRYKPNENVYVEAQNVRDV